MNPKCKCRDRGWAKNGKAFIPPLMEHYTWAKALRSMYWSALETYYIP